MERKQLLQRVFDQFQVAKVVGLLGPRQSGKTTLARQFVAASSEPFNEALNYFDLEDQAHLDRLATPKLALEQMLRASGVWEEEACYWGVHNQAELDLLLFRGGKQLGFEVKYTDTPRVTASQRAALGTLRLDSLTIVCPGDADHPLEEKIRVRGLTRFARGHEVFQ
jgi:predicted AAA+ superfamily ATPase